MKKHIPFICLTIVSIFMIIFAGRSGVLLALLLMIIGCDMLKG